MPKALLISSCLPTEKDKSNAHQIFVQTRSEVGAEVPIKSQKEAQFVSF
jgi:hypothetical protein